jgi:hypothetical protein
VAVRLVGGAVVGVPFGDVIDLALVAGHVAAEVAAPLPEEQCEFSGDTGEPPSFAAGVDERGFGGTSRGPRRR